MLKFVPGTNLYLAMWVKLFA